jgi:hypothetical protein
MPPYTVIKKSDVESTVAQQKKKQDNRKAQYNPSIKGSKVLATKGQQVMN